VRDPYESAPCGLLVSDEGGPITRVNATICNWLQRRPEQLVGVCRFEDLLTMGGKIFHETHWMPLLQLQGSVDEVQLELVLPSGSLLPVLTNAVRNGEEKTIEVAVFVTHDRRKYERELLYARRRAEEALENERCAQRALAEAARARDQLAEQLIGIVSHDLRTPLSAIELGAHVLASKETSHVQARTIEHIGSAARRAKRLIGDLLDFTQARVGGGLRVDPEPLDLHAVVADSTAELRLAWPGRMIEHVATGTGKGLADPDRIAQVVTNLAVNALTYGRPAEPVTIESRGNGDALQVRVHNWGMPIPDSLRPVIFEPLRRGEQQVKLGSRSVGLGLYIVQQIALAHGGTVELNSSAEEGTWFTVTFPQPA
jgi:phosphoserine phosphatase RsbU/P